MLAITWLCCCVHVACDDARYARWPFGLGGFVARYAPRLSGDAGRRWVDGRVTDIGAI